MTNEKVEHHKNKFEKYIIWERIKHKINISEGTENQSALVLCNDSFQLLSLESEQWGM